VPGGRGPRRAGRGAQWERGAEPFPALAGGHVYAGGLTRQSLARRMAKVAAMKESFYGKYTEFKNEKELIETSA